ncbi:hypothetical protein QCA50_005736 [Cerrena zonata]|uniref:Sodium/calcium exchanger membrane region domain-containing protein n=1 Tax=Cerrena zonata TaxID=2478898 RepID=A0AAW0GDX2_9APHY
MWSGTPRIFFVLTLVLNCILWSQSRYAQVQGVHSTTRGSLARRSGLDIYYGAANVSLGGLEEDKCHPIALPIEAQCPVAQDSCPYSETFLSIPYLQNYFCSKQHVRPFMFAGLIVWLIFLFSTLGISASDFFCPNLSTLSQILGLDENVAGVTFLAFGNGSPDVFATFSAMRSNSGGLAIGELLGAASFVTSCVVGSMCIIKPFKVDRGPFLRDVGFFTVAVILLLVVLWDNQIEEWEAAMMVVMYLIYVAVVIVGSWYERRRERIRQRDAMMRDEFREEDIPQTPYRDEPELSPSPTNTMSLQIPSSAGRARAISSPGPPRLGLELPPRPHSRAPSTHSAHSSRTTSNASHHRHSSSHSHINHMPSFSLIGALEFSRVVSELQQQSASSTLSLFESPLTPYPGGHYHTHRGSRPRSPADPDHERDPWDAALHGVPLNDRSPQGQVPALSEPRTEELVMSDGQTPMITITHTPASPLSDVTSEAPSMPFSQLGKRQRLYRMFSHTHHVLFPTLHHFRSKTFLGKIAAVFAAPAVMALTLTLPVVVTDYASFGEREEKLGTDEGRLIDFEEEGVERTLIDEDHVEEELKFNKWLMAVQCILGPLFCIAVLFDGTKHEPWLLLASAVIGTAAAILVAVFSKSGSSPGARLTRCAMGFMVAIVWIMAIADEVVQVLQTFGLIFGLSDAIIGITIFAMGNSLADLVANMSVAVFAPIMGFSACFGGPMLNILLGIGISGSYIIRQNGGEAYPLHFSTTLVLTGAGLLGLLVLTLLFVPWNGYFLPRSWGVVLIVAYIGLMAANVIVEIKTASS